MAQISPKQIDWSQSISGSLIPFVSGAATSSVYSLGTPSASWATAYIDQLDVSNISIDQVDLDNLELQTLVVNQDTQLKNNTEITGSVRILGSLDVDGPTTLNGLGQSASLEVAGQINVINQQISQSVQKAKITIENLGEIGNKEENLVLDLGGFF